MYIPTDTDTDTEQPFYKKFALMVQRPTGEIVMVVDFRLTDWLNFNDMLEKLAPIQAEQLVPYTMLVDYENIFIFDFRRSNWQEPILKLSTLEMLPEEATLIREGNVFGWSFVKFIRFWLDYLAHPNYGKTVPGVKELESVGLMTQILGAKIRDLVQEG